jgi:hypothetical protein
MNRECHIDLDMCYNHLMYFHDIIESIHKRLGYANDSFLYHPIRMINMTKSVFHDFPFARTPTKNSVGYILMQVHRHIDESTPLHISRSSIHEVV